MFDLKFLINKLKAESNVVLLYNFTVILLTKNLRKLKVTIDIL